MSIGDRMKMRRKQLKISADEIASALGVSRSTIFRYEKGEIEKLPTERLSTIAMILKTTPEELMGWNSGKTSSSIEAIYNKLNETAQKEVYSFAEKKLEEQESLNSKIIPMVGKTAASPTVLEYGDVDIEQQSFSHVPEGADCAIYIQGDSMEPLIKDGSIVFYKRQEDVESGEIAVVEINGDGATCKRVIKDYDNKQIILRSVNDHYEDRILHDEKVRIIGKVIL